MADINPEDVKNIGKEFRARNIPFVDRHTHTINKYTESWDITKEPIEGPSLKVIEFASKSGFEEIAITDHSYEIFMEPQMEERTKLQVIHGNNMFAEYLKYIDNVKKRCKDIKIIGGIELKLRTMDDLKFIDPKQLSLLDIILIETPLKKLDFDEIRKKIGPSAVIIMAHPDPEYNFGAAYIENEISEWVGGMVRNNIHFDLNRQFLDKFLIGGAVYDKFFDIAKNKGLVFSIGSDYHLKPQNYIKYLTKMLNVIKKYELTEENFLSLKK